MSVPLSTRVTAGFYAIIVDIIVADEALALKIAQVGSSTTVRKFGSTRVLKLVATRPTVRFGCLVAACGRERWCRLGGDYIGGGVGATIWAAIFLFNDGRLRRATRVSQSLPGVG